MRPMTFQQLLEEDQVRKDTSVPALEAWVSARVSECMENPDEHSGKPKTVIAGEHCWANQAAHQCYWNNRFVLAVMCGLGLWKMRQSAWYVVSNGIMGYFEWKTHAGYDMAKVLERLGIDTSTLDKTCDGVGYCKLAPSVCKVLIETFDLPTTAFGVKKSLTPDQLRDRAEIMRGVFAPVAPKMME